MSSIRDKLGLVKTEIPIDEIPSHTQEISDWLRLRYLNETNQNSYVLTAFDWIEESVPQKYKLQQINTNVDISSKVEKEIIWDNISEFVERKNVKEVVGLPNEEYSKNLTSNFHKTFQDVIGDVQYSQIVVNPWPEKIPDLDSKDKLFIRYSYDVNSPLDMLAADTYVFVKAMSNCEYSPLVSLLIMSGAKKKSQRIRMLYLIGDDESLPITNVFRRISQEYSIKNKLIGVKNGKEKV